MYNGWTPPNGWHNQPASRAGLEALLEKVSQLSYSQERENARFALQNAIECLHALTNKLFSIEEPSEAHDPRTPAEVEADEADRDWSKQVTELRGG